MAIYLPYLTSDQKNIACCFQKMCHLRTKRTLRLEGFGDIFLITNETSIGSMGLVYFPRNEWMEIFVW